MYSREGSPKFFLVEDGVIGQADVSDIEVDQLGAVVGLCAEGDCEPHLPQRGRETLCHPREGPGGHEPLVRHLKLLEGLDRDDVEACTPTINNIAVSKTLIDGGAGLSVISVETFEKLQVPYERLMPTSVTSKN